MMHLFHLKQRILVLLLSILGIGGIAGCVSTSEAKRVVLVSESEALFKTGSDVEGHLYFWNGSTWELSKDKVKLPEGWLTGPMNSTNNEK
jgi:hypothetical protein